MSDGGARSPAAGRLESFARVIFAYVVALAVALWLAAGGRGEHPLLTLAVADVVATVVIFAFSMRWNNGSVYDPYWSVAPPFVALFWIGHASGASTVRQVTATVLVFLWGIRLTYNWARGWPGLHHEDWRYIDLYATAPMPKWAISFLGIHLFPTVMVLLGCLALIPALARGSNPFGLLDAAALVVTAAAILIEWVADEQLRGFGGRKQPGEIIQSGLWAYSRHPNYFGEISFWWGLFLFALAADASYWWMIIGPLSMTAMFHWASIPMLDRRSVARRPGYDEHMRRVNAVIPWPWG
jgi:steroid 5-alpha reductase family enzyme